MKVGVGVTETDPKWGVGGDITPARRGGKQESQGWLLIRGEGGLMRGGWAKGREGGGMYSGLRGRCYRDGMVRESGVGRGRGVGGGGGEGGMGETVTGVARLCAGLALGGERGIERVAPGGGTRCVEGLSSWRRRGKRFERGGGLPLGERKEGRVRGAGVWRGRE